MRRRWLVVGGIALGGLLVCAAIFVFFLYGPIAAYVVREKVIPRLEARLDREIEVDSVSVSRGELVLRGIRVRGERDGELPLFAIDRVDATFDFWASLRGDMDVGDVTISGLVASARRDQSGQDNYRDVVERLRPKHKDGAEPVEGGVSGLRPDQMRLVDGALTYEDEGAGVTLAASGVGAIASGAPEVMVTIGEVEGASTYGQRATARAVVVSLDRRDLLGSAHLEIGDGEVLLWRGMRLTGVVGTISQDDQPGRLLVDLAGGYGGAEGKLWRAVGRIDPVARTGRLEVEADRFTFDRIGDVLADSMVVDYDDTSIDASLVVNVEAGRAAFEGDLTLTGLNVFHEMAAQLPIRHIDLTGTVEGVFDMRSRTLELPRAVISLRGVDYYLDGTVELPHGVVEGTDSRRAEARLAAHLAVKPVPCQTFLESIPPEFVPKLQGFVLTGDFATDITVEVDWADLEATVLDGYVGINKCKVKDVPESFDAELLEESFEHDTLIGPEEWETVVVGMENEDYVHIFDVSPYLLKSFMTTEDSRFYDHHGFIVREFRAALIKNLDAGYFKYGASSITMQMVKNVFLFREKTLARKFQELFLTWYVEGALTKDRIFEIYVNAIEYGPGVYGIKPAAEIYFDKHPRELNPVEAAYFSSLLPAPRRRYFQYCKGKVSRWTQNKIQRVLKLMHQRERLTDEEYELALETPLEFNPYKIESLCKQRPDW